MILYYLLGLASAFIFSEWGGFLPTVLIVGVAAALVVEASIKRIYVLAFVLGIFHDLINGTLLGMTAIYLLIAVWGMLFVQKKFRKSLKTEDLSLVYKALDKAAKVNLIKKNKASRVKSRLTHLMTKSVKAAS